ncbi:MAG: GGDEF domain-containing protein [Ruminococcus sp.]|nr:GGDEF domain-containing protein [Ruminococcus sp.]
MEKKQFTKIRGIKFHTLNYFIVLVACILYVLIIYATIQVSVKYDDMVSATNAYIGCTKEIARVKEGSDYLTEQARLYAVMMTPFYMEQYLEEANVTKRRENGMEAMEQYSFGEKEHQLLQTALKESDQLMEKELYAMKLISVANAYDAEMLPDEVREIQLTTEDQALSSEKMVSRAQEMVFGSAYQQEKAQIMKDINLFIDTIVSQTEGIQEERVQSLEQTLREQRVLISLLFVMNILTFILIVTMIVKPLQLHINCIQEGKLLQITGAYEFRYLALIYNDIYELKTANEALLRHKAEHDPLTGIANRGAFEQLRTLLKATKTPIAFLLIDVDEFKQINDGFGHETGDEILKKVARLMQEQIRSQDYAARIGGDEFAIIMTEIEQKQKEVIEKKVQEMNRKLQNPEDGLPPVSLSVGISFSREGFSEDLYKNTDQALYYVKENGRNGWKFYEELPSTQR